MSHKDTTLTGTIRAAVVKSGMSQYEFAKRCGFSNRVIGRLLRGTDIRLGTADKILKALNLQVKLEQEK
jgi:transcriptional regulator with XRE-family HTH domain